MPVSGGAADKLGNRYEILWTLDQLLQIVDGALSELTPEPLDVDESRGVEFHCTTSDAIIHYWSVKRQTTKASGWTLGLLAAKDDRGRSILGDLFQHVQKKPTHHGFFASSLGARDLEELRTHAASKKMFEQRLARSKELRADFNAYVLPICDGDLEIARCLLLRLFTRAADEPQLKERVNFAIRKLFYSRDSIHLDTDSVRGYLTDLLLENIHRVITREMILAHLSNHAVGLRDWNIEKSVRDRIASICDSFVSPLKSELINNQVLPIANAESLVDLVAGSITRNVLVVGKAGAGKSSTLANLVEELCKAGTPVVPIRFDQLPEGILTSTELGHKLLLPESPALVLAGVAAGRPAVLVADQLDAISIASGRRIEMWALFDQLRQEIALHSNTSLVVGCREFDLEHDSRFRSMKQQGSNFHQVTLSDLTSSQVEQVLRAASIDPASVQPVLQPILTIPLHLALYLRLSPESRQSVHNREELFGSFWEEAERRVTQRLGRPAMWTQTIDKLTGWLSDHQEISAPDYVLDDFAADASAMASEHFLVVRDQRYRFFHESLFDYAFARRFASRGGQLLDLLLSGEQHLFRRAQVRQILSFMRARDEHQYLRDLKAVLSHTNVRFHIKAAILQWLSSLTDPKSSEWEVLQGVISSVPDMRDHVRAAIEARPPWFDILLAAGFFDANLSSGDELREREAVWIVGLHPILESRSRKVAELLRKYKQPDEKWRQFLRYVCRTGAVFQAREMFDLFLLLVDDGTLDGARPGLAENDDWWSLLYSMAEERPDLTCEAIAHWFDRTLDRWRAGTDVMASSGDQGAAWSALKALFQGRGHHGAILAKAAGAPLAYAQQMLPRIARFIDETAKERSGRLRIDPLWSWRTFGNNPFHVHEAILEWLAHSLEQLAKTNPAELDELLKPYQALRCDAVAFLVLRAWTASPGVYADSIADYLIEDPRRLKIGYDSAGSGSFQNHVSVKAIGATAGRCSAQRLRGLEEAVISLADDWEAKHPSFRGIRQLELLRAMDGASLHTSARAKLQELQRKFPEAKHEEPQPIQGGAVGFTIPQEAQAKMSNEHWLKAMRKYAARSFRFADGKFLWADQHQLSIALMAQAELDPARFSGLAEEMSDDLPGSYFDAILRGVAGSIERPKNNSAISVLTEHHAAALLERVHRLPNRPCGRAIAWLMAKTADFEWNQQTVEHLCWYAVHDADPKGERNEDKTTSADKDTGANSSSASMETGMVETALAEALDSVDPVQLGELEAENDSSKSARPTDRKRDHYSHGINSVRGAVAETIGQLLFKRNGLLSTVELAIDALAHDPSIAVRSCAIFPLFALLTIDAPKAIRWFKECVALDAAVLRTPYVERFIHLAAYRDFDAILPILNLMLSFGDDDTVSAAAREVCLLSLDIDSAEQERERIENGTVAMRKAAVHVYAVNVAHEAVGEVFRQRLKPFFSDEDATVRVQAASAFEFIANLSTSAQADLLSAFLKTNPDSLSLLPVVRSLGHSPVDLPSLVCQLIQSCIRSYGSEAGDISKSASVISMDLSKMVVRLYAQSKDRQIQSQCLDLIDTMERHHFLGLTEELRRLDR
jgi:hypothetical protein